MCERMLTVWRWVCSTHPGVGGVVVVRCSGMSSTSLCVLTSTIGIVCGRLPVVGQNFLENGPP